MNAYLTLSRMASDEIVIQKSRFIGYAAPCETEEEALAFLQSIRDRHRDSRHACYAYIIGQNEGVMRYSDDGEPGGTAGLPIMGVLRGRHLVNCAVVVVRYFGGILLGTGGLVRAYSEACWIAVQAAGVMRMDWTCRELCEVPYSCWDSLQHTVRSLPVQLEDIQFETAVAFTLLVREADRDRILDALQRVTNRQLTCLPDGESYAFWPVSEEQSESM